MILLGRTNMFRFNHPKEAAKLREKRKVSSVESWGAKSTLGGGWLGVGEEGSPLWLQQLDFLGQEPARSLD